MNNFFARMPQQQQIIQGPYDPQQQAQPQMTPGQSALVTGLEGLGGDPREKEMERQRRMAMIGSYVPNQLRGLGGAYRPGPAMQPTAVSQSQFGGGYDY